MAKLAYVLFLVLLVSISCNELIDLIRCIYQNMVPHVQLIFELIDAIKAQDWITVITRASKIYQEFKNVLALCKSQSAPHLF